MVLRKLILAVVLLLAGAVSAAPTVLVYLRPADEGARDKSFAAFRTKLRSAIARRDWSAFAKLADPKIKFSFGGDEGLLQFKKSWDANSPATQLWNALGQVINHGGHFNSKTEFAAPYVYSAWPDDYDAFSHVAVTSPDAEMFSGPHESRPVIRKVGFEILEVLKSSGKFQHEAGEADWDEVKTLDGRRGFIQSKLVRSPVEYRAIFERRKGIWRMTVFIAGD